MALNEGNISLTGKLPKVKNKERNIFNNKIEEDICKYAHEILGKFQCHF